MKKKVFLSLVLMLCWAFAVPAIAMAAPAIVNFSMDRTTVNSGQSISFNVRTTAQTQFVFAMVDGVRTQGSRVGNSNDWVVTVTPNRTTTVSIFANTNNSENGAAIINIPVTVGAATTTVTTPTTPAVTIPAAPANLGPIAIASITETPATGVGYVQLTIVTGSETNEVWVNFNRTNNARGTGHFARGTMTTQDSNSRTWVVNFRPSTWAVQQVEVGSNRTYNWPGAATQLYNLTLTQPFVAPVTPRINNVNVANRTVTPGGNTTFTITTNLDVEHVWVRDVDGREHNATRSTSGATTRTWRVTFPPIRSGNVTIFANATRNTDNAATRTENITVSHTTGQIIGTPTASWTHHHHSNETLIQVTTNSYVQTVWATMPGTGNRVQLSRTNSGTGNRSWSVIATDTVSHGNIIINVSTTTGNLNTLTAEDTRTITRTHGTTGSGWIHSSVVWPGTSTALSRGQSATFRVVTSPNITNLTVTGGHGTLARQPQRTLEHNNETEWLVEVIVGHNAPTGQNVFQIGAYSGNSRVDTRSLPAITVVN
ncbi:MAG: hypothetical protein FWF78_05275 [Defluviitaleaceae bacterium]|nr:hypothetical protein [Defluviitaleaceae bacterium]